jgi:hypothetical protein
MKSTNAAAVSTQAVSPALRPSGPKGANEVSGNARTTFGEPPRDIQAGWIDLPEKGLVPRFPGWFGCVSAA